MQIELIIATDENDTQKVKRILNYTTKKKLF